MEGENGSKFKLMLLHFNGNIFKSLTIPTNDKEPQGDWVATTEKKDQISRSMA